MILGHVLHVVHEGSGDVADSGGALRTVTFTLQCAKVFYDWPAGRHLESAGDAARRAGNDRPLGERVARASGSLQMVDQATQELFSPPPERTRVG